MILSVSYKKETREFFYFLLVGFFNTSITYLVFLLLLNFLPYLASYSLTYCIGVVISYFLNARFVFGGKVCFNSFVAFLVIYVVQYVLGIATLWLLVVNADLAPRQAMVFVMGMTIPVAFLLSRFVFRNLRFRADKVESRRR